MELTEAVRSVREERWGGTRHQEARETVLAALEQAQPCTHMEGYVERLEAERDALQAERNTLRGAIEVWQREAQSGWESARIAEAERDALDRDFAAFRATALETSNHMHDVIRERDALRVDLAQARSGWAAAGALLEATRAERDALRATLTEETQKRLRAESEEQQQRTYARNCGEQLATLRAEVERRKADAALIVQKIQRALDGEKP